MTPAPGAARVPVWADSATDVAAAHGTDPATGLGAGEAARRLGESGRNTLDPPSRVSPWRRFGVQFSDPLVVLLLAAIAASLVAWLVEGAAGTPFEAIVVAAIVVVNAIVGFVQEERAEHAVDALQRLTADTATVVRDGSAQEIPTAEVVTGDLLVLEEGDLIAADGRLLAVASLQVKEAALTGESEPVLKSSAPLPATASVGERLNMVFSGTAVSRGRARAVVTATGMRTEVGRIAELVGATAEAPTPLEKEIARVGRLLGIAVLAIAAVMIAIVLLTADVETADDVVQVLFFGVALAVAAVPEGLPAIVSIALAVGVQRMARARAIVKKLSSVETLGSASVICSDKTGTLTTNEMTIVSVVTGSGEVGITDDGAVDSESAPLCEGALLEEVRAVIAGGGLAGDAELVERDGLVTAHGDPTDVAFLVAERALGLTAAVERGFERVGELPFTAERRLMSSLEQDEARAGHVTVVTKGAPDALLGRCSHERVAGALRPLTGERRRQILAGVERLADQALRTLAVAYRELPGGAPAAPDESLEHELVYLGVAGMIDPPRPEARAAIERCNRAGVRVLMLTGDHPRTAARIAADLGIAVAGAPVLTGADLDALGPEEFKRAVGEVPVYARVSPEQKLKIVDALQAKGHVVAVTGDGVNDAPALKSADIGVAMGIAGTDVTKESALMILADDNFATIVGAVREGRGIFSNIRKCLRYLLSSNAGEVLTVFLGVAGAGLIGLRAGGEGLAIPLLATQILWINLITDSAPALALAVDQPPADIMDRPPRGAGERVIDRPMQAGIVVVGLTMAAVSLLALDLQLPGGLIEGNSGLDKARTTAFTVLVLAQLFNCFNARSDSASAFRRPFSNPLLWAAVAASSALQVLVVHAPFLNDAFQTVPLSAGEWLVCVALASTVLWVSELRKLVGRRG